MIYDNLHAVCASELAKMAYDRHSLCQIRLPKAATQLTRNSKIKRVQLLWYLRVKAIVIPCKYYHAHDSCTKKDHVRAMGKEHQHEPTDPKSQFLDATFLVSKQERSRPKIVSWQVTARSSWVNSIIVFFQA